jgi:hypothetical protein
MEQTVRKILKTWMKNKTTQIRGKNQLNLGQALYHKGMPRR